MEKIKQKITSTLRVLQALSQNIKIFNEYQEFFNENPTPKNKKTFSYVRDSMIFRFKNCTIFFWKTIEAYLIDQGVNLDNQSPKYLLRESVNAGLLSELEGTKFMKMIESSNKISQEYLESMAKEITRDIPKYHKLMKAIIERSKTF